MSGTNPFASLIEDNPEKSSTATIDINKILEDLFGFTLDQQRGIHKQLIYLEEIANSFNRNDLDLDILQHALFDRLFMCNDENLIIKDAKRTFRNSNIYETKVIVYLYNCYKSVNETNQLTNDEKTKINELIVQNTATALIQSEIYTDQNVDQQFLDVLKDGLAYSDNYFKDVYNRILIDEDGGEDFIKTKFTEILLLLTSEIKQSNIVIINSSIFNVLQLFTIDERLARIFLTTKPQKFVTGADYAHTPLGALLNTSILPKTPGGIYEHFHEDPLNQNLQANVAATERLLWSSIDKLMLNIHKLIKSLLTCNRQIRNETLDWIGQCLKANNDRRKLWNTQSLPELNPSNYTTVTDGFMINLSNVLLRLCEPFCSDTKREKILQIDPTYCNVPNELLAEKSVHLPDVSSETCLLPRDNNIKEDQALIAQNYSFLSECFYLTHKAIDLGFQVTNDKLARLNNDVGRIERAYLDAMAQARHNNELIDSLQRRMNQQLTQYLSMKAQLADPILLNLFFDFISSSTYWLNQIAVHIEHKSHDTFAPLDEIPIQFPLPEEIPNTLKCIPEFIIENIISYLIFLKRFAPQVYEEQGYNKMKPILTFILIYMGSPERLKNPHLRARLAEGLESLLPVHDNERPPPILIASGDFQRQMLFAQHEHRDEIVTNLLKVFVSIEMTGQSVEFGQKFNYRRPMYNVISYIWAKPEYRNKFKELAEEAEQNMEAVTPPLFLRFVNLLMNDAVYLLDEALTNMAKLREMQTARENGEWDRLPLDERTQNVQYMNQIGMIAKFDNILGRDTIKTLEKLTSVVTIVFTHSTMVDRVAAMLNYFLYNLVGPNKKNFKVNNQKEYSFDPANTVLNICKIYVNLKDSDSFCLAVSQDGRSYSPQLFTLAEDVLIRIGGGVLIGELKDVADRVAQKAKEYQENEEVISEAPEHFLDPIMSTLMTDPVILPSSKQTVDRTTIARHLLSDQTDPFNRAPLSMDQVIPNKELAEEIRQWLAERRK